MAGVTSAVHIGRINAEVIMSSINPTELIQQLEDARARTLALVAGLNDEQLMGPRLPTINPLRWEIAHAAYFYEYWILRNHFKENPQLSDVDKLFDSIDIPHETRWDLPLPSLNDTLDYMQAILERTRTHLASDKADAKRDYLAQYAIFHEDMHCEAYSYTRQTLAYPAPKIPRPEFGDQPAEQLRGDANIPGGEFRLGALPDSGFVFDNEKWAHLVEVKPFQIARTAVSNIEYIEFIEQGGYAQREYWDNEGWQWKDKNSLQQPIYWRRSGHSGWEFRHFDKWIPLPAHAAVIHVSWYEAQAFCRWAGRRLPSELEWEVAAAGEPAADGKTLSENKRYYPWGNTTPSVKLANLDGNALGVIDVSALPAGDSAFGCRQMLGNVWEWTESIFSPYPDFTPDMYQDYSQPLFGSTRVLRGGAWATRARMIRNTFRTYYGPDRNDVFAGFRTCAL